jgi:hypothetical protein
MQRRCKHAFQTIEKLFSAWSMQSGYKEEFSEVSRVFETPACQDMSLGAEEMN